MNGPVDEEDNEDEEEQAATVDEYLKRGKWGASARMR